MDHHKVLFTFAGTGGTAKHEQLSDQYSSIRSFNEGVVRIYFNGCQDSRIGGKLIGGMVSPNLDVVASKLRSCFDGNELSLARLKREFGSAVIIEGASSDAINVEDITLAGFSRGAVTTFAAARHLDELGIPISLFAQDPVSGDSKANAAKPSSEYFKNQFLTELNNLNHAVVLLSVHKKDVNPLHNKFFRLMAPFFSKRCSYAIYTVPKSHHTERSRCSENHKEAFFRARDLTSGRFFENQVIDNMFYVPKILQQKFHVGVVGRTQLAPRYKQQLFDKIYNSHKRESKDGSVKRGQALYALDVALSFSAKNDLNDLYDKIKTDLSDDGIALREFIVEFENLNQYVFRKTSDGKSLTALNEFRIEVYKLINSYQGEKANEKQKKDLTDGIITCVTKLKGEVPEKLYAEFSKHIPVFLKDNILFHPELTKYIDESETYREKTLSSEEGVRVDIKDIKDIDNAEDLALALHHLSERSRVAAYDKFKAKLPDMVKDVKQLGRILCYLPPKHIAAILNRKKMLALIETADDYDLIKTLLFTDDQIKILSNAVKDKLVAPSPIVKAASESDPAPAPAPAPAIAATLAPKSAPSPRGPPPADAVAANIATAGSPAPAPALQATTPPPPPPVKTIDLLALKKECEDMLLKIKALGFGDNDKAMNDYLLKKQSDIKKEQNLDKIKDIHSELTTALSKMRNDSFAQYSGRKV